MITNTEFASRVVALMEDVAGGDELSRIGPSAEFMATQLQKHSMTVEQIEEWSKAARIAIQKSDMAVIGKILDVGLGLIKQVGIFV